MLFVGFAGTCLASVSASPAETLLDRERPLVIAHRGYSELAPENTLPAFRYALTSGVDLIELDYQVTRDGIPVALHDATLNRTSNAGEKWSGEAMRVAERTAAELDELDAGSWFHARFTGTPVPRLTEALDFIQGGGGVTLIERKAGPADALVALLRERELVNEVIVQAFDWEFLSEVHARQPDQVLGALGPPQSLDGRKLSRNEKELDTQWIDRAKEAGARVIGWNRQVSSDAVAYAHRQGLEVWVYTINEQPVAEWLLELGVDGIISDNPAVVWKALAGKR